MNMVSNDCFKMMHIFFSRSFYFRVGFQLFIRGSPIIMLHQKPLWMLWVAQSPPSEQFTFLVEKPSSREHSSSKHLLHLSTERQETIPHVRTQFQSMNMHYPGCYQFPHFLTLQRCSFVCWLLPWLVSASGMERAKLKDGCSFLKKQH